MVRIVHFNLQESSVLPKLLFLGITENREDLQENNLWYLFFNVLLPGKIVSLD